VALVHTGLVISNEGQSVLDRVARVGSDEVIMAGDRRGDSAMIKGSPMLAKLRYGAQISTRTRSN
jgi:hypothetical protein